MAFLLRGLTAASLMVVGGQASAQTQGGATIPWFSGVKTELSVGVMRGKAQELVFDTSDGAKISQLDWTFDNVAMFNTHTSVQVLKWLRAGFRASTNLTGASTMDDYDFDLMGCPPSGAGTLCHSNHPDTRLRQAMMLDIYGAAQVYNNGGVTLSALAGYKRDHFAWQAIGGTANYATLPPGVGISYEQTWSAPYLGIGLAVEAGAWTVNGRLIGSAWAKGSGIDDHHLRALTFTDEYQKAKMVAAEVGIAYRLNSYLSLTGDYRFQQWGTGKGPTRLEDRLSGGTAVFTGDASGGNARTHMLSLGVKVDLQPATQGAGMKDEPVARPSTWTGWSFGAMAGITSQRARWTTTAIGDPLSAPFSPGDTGDLDGDGRRAGLFLGHTWRTQRGLIWGIEADVGKANTSAWQHGIPGTIPAPFLGAFSDVAMVSAGWDASLRLRAGMQLTPSLLAYATGGLAVQQITASASCSFFPWCTDDRMEDFTATKAGWTAGLGYEMNFAGGWFTRGEYRYTSLGRVSHTFFADEPSDQVASRIDLNSHRLTFGLGYRF